MEVTCKKFVLYVKLPIIFHSPMVTKQHILNNISQCMFIRLVHLADG